MSSDSLIDDTGTSSASRGGTAVIWNPHRVAGMKGRVKCNSGDAHTRCWKAGNSWGWGG